MISFLNDEQDSMKQSFQAGVDTLYNKCVSCGQTPTDKSPTSISNAIQDIYNNRYNEGYEEGQVNNGIYGKYIHFAHQVSGWGAITVPIPPSTSQIAGYSNRTSGFNITGNFSDDSSELIGTIYSNNSEEPNIFDISDKNYVSIYIRIDGAANHVYVAFLE